MKRYKIKCTETATYEFEVDARDEDDAWFVAHDILLGRVDKDGTVIKEAAIRLVEPDGTPIECDVIDREWDITEE